jgi:hypothetical protein
MSKIRQLLDNDRANAFDALYKRRSKFLRDGSGQGTSGDAADAALEIGLELLLADTTQSPPATAGGGMEAVTVTDKDGATFMLTITVRPSGYSTRGQVFDGLIDGEFIVHRSATPWSMPAVRRPAARRAPRDDRRAGVGRHRWSARQRPQQ